MDYLREYKLLILELRMLCQETLRRAQSVEDDDYAPRRHFALAQVAGSRDLLQYLLDNDDEWTEYGEFLEATLEGEESRYWEAWRDDDRQIMTIALANCRLLKRLIRRLTDPRRRQLLLSHVDLQPQGAEDGGGLLPAEGE